MKPLRILIIASHPVQYAIPTYRRFAEEPDVEVTVAFCSLIGAEPMDDPDFGVSIAWDVPMLEGYRWVAVKNLVRDPTSRRFFGLINPGLWGVIRKGKFDVVVSTGYRSLTFWIGFLAAKRSSTRWVWSTDQYGFGGLAVGSTKRGVKQAVMPRIYALADGIFCMSSRGTTFFRSLKLRRPKVFLTPYVVDNAFFASGAAGIDRKAVREELGIPPKAFVVIVCGKLVPWKAPADVVAAVADIPDAHVLFVGDGPLREELVQQAASLSLTERVHFAGFVNQTGLPRCYAASDVLVLPSTYDAFGLVVNEAFASGIPAIVSAGAGCSDDLVEDGVTGFTYAARDIPALREHLALLADDRERAPTMGKAASERISRWGPNEFVTAVVQACRDLRSRGR